MAQNWTRQKKGKRIELNWISQQLANDVNVVEALSVIKGRTLTKLVWSLDFFYVSSGSKKGRREREKTPILSIYCVTHEERAKYNNKKKQHHPIPSSSLPSAIGCWPSFPHNKRNVINKYSPLSPGQQTHTQDPVITRLDPIKCQQQSWVQSPFSFITKERPTQSKFDCRRFHPSKKVQQHQKRALENWPLANRISSSPSHRK